MIIKPSHFFMLVLTVSQAFAKSVPMLQLRGLEILEPRQSVCPVCTDIADALSICSGYDTVAAAVKCACAPTLAAQVRSCIECGYINGNPPSVQKLSDSYYHVCPSSSSTGGPAATGVSKVSSGTSDKGKRAGVAAIVAIVGVALVL